MMEFSEYIDSLCREHKLVQHSDKECHFSNLISDFDNKLQRVMHYPCVGIDTEGFSIEGSFDNELQADVFNIYFLTHVRDHGSLAEKMSAFKLTYQILIDFVGRFKRDSEHGVEPMTRFSMLGSEATRIEFTDNALYGWVLSITVNSRIFALNCNGNFNS